MVTPPMVTPPMKKCPAEPPAPPVRKLASTAHETLVPALLLPPAIDTSSNLNLLAPSQNGPSPTQRHQNCPAVKPDSTRRAH